MLRMQSNNRVLTMSAAIAVATTLAAPARAADGGKVETRHGLDRISAWALKLKERKSREGPYAPIVGALDLGTAENGFGAARSGHVHAGQDVFAPAGTPLVAVSDAIVIDAGSDGGQGNYVHLFDRKRERTYVYMHMVEQASVSTGERVEAGERVGGVGCTGSCWGDHLHFEVREGRGFTAGAIDPLPLIREWKSPDHPG